jgi:cytochrome c biogenesis protein CcmG, thiol:disulfide interchange protein DsbE
MRIPDALSRLTWLETLRGLSRGRKIAVAAGACALVTAVLLGSIGSADGSAHTALPTARSLTLHPLSQGSPELSLTQYRGRAVVINFFASWCVPCKAETPLLARFYRAHHGQVPIIGVDVNDSTAAARRFIRAAGVEYPVGSDPAGAAATRYGVVAIPQTFFLNTGHRIVKRVFGAVTLAELNAGLARMR